MKAAIISCLLLAVAAPPPAKIVKTPSPRSVPAKGLKRNQPARPMPPKAVIKTQSSRSVSGKGTSSKKQKAKIQRPAECAKITDLTIKVLQKAVDVLATESRRKGAKSPKQGQKSLRRYLATIKDEISRLRGEAAALKLDDVTFRACEEDANKAFLKTLARLSTMRSFYKADPETFRMIGDLFK
ncbi:MAG TPA: hypothetical protein EYN06_01205 [Myxococcales bacterium]|nr:hypothetical protein [Myxococcales bacterium]HIN85067.1 hypothetical protein [Myxococcales bacterium]